MGKATGVVADRFEGFADTKGSFFAALASNQRRDWFEANRQQYERGWVQPMKALLAEIRTQVESRLSLPLGEPKVFRIYRDVRFSKDKSPYKTHIGGYVGIDSSDWETSAPVALYLHIGAEEVFAGAGQYMMDAAQLDRYRAAVVDESSGKRLTSILGTLTRAGFATGSYATLKKVPRGFDPEHPRAELLKSKGLIVTFPALPAELLVEPALVGWLAKHTKRALPLVEWLAEVL